MTMRHVAEKAGVSISTVSRVINDHPSIARETIAAVRGAMQELRFKPSVRRNGMDGGRKSNGTRTETIAFLVFGTNGTQVAPAFERLLRGVSDAAGEAGKSLVFAYVSDPSHLPPNVLNGRVDGVLLHGHRPGAAVMARLKDLPTVWLMANRQRPLWGDQVMPDNFAIGEIAAQYLLRRGHRKLAFLKAATDGWSLKIRALAFAHTAADAGATVQIIEADEPASPDMWSPRGLATTASTLVDKVLAMDPRPTGLCVAEDRFLAEIDYALTRKGFGNDSDCNPFDILSCNNERRHLTGLRSPVAAIDIRTDLIGRRGVEQLLWRMRNADQSGRVCLMIEPSLVEPVASG